jgi:uncharacterized membrane protein YkvI
MNDGAVSHSVFNRIWLPGLLLQSVIIGGGYATGRELVEFFLSAGPVGGLLGMLVATLLFSVASILSFELARLTASFNYRSFFTALLGRGWFLYEIVYFVLGLLILAVIAAASGEMFAAHMQVDRIVGTVLLIAPIGLLVFWGTSLIENVLAGWSFVLYGTYLVLVALYLWHFGARVPESFASLPPATNWFNQGVRYFGYNVAVIPLILFCVRHMRSRRDAVAAGMLAGPLIMLPAAMFFVAMSASYPEILGIPVPADFMLHRLGMPWLQGLFYIVVFGTFVETGTALIHALNERIDLSFRVRARHIPRWLRPAVAVAALGLAVVLAVRFGIINLIARGYGTLTWAVIVIFIVPLCTIGVARIFRSQSQPAAEAIGTD